MVKQSKSITAEDKEIRVMTNTAKGLCERCGEVYDQGPHSFYCPKCRKIMQSERAKRVNLSAMGQRARQRK